MQLSVIIPTWREPECIEGCVAHALSIGDEAVVVDGGSDDATVERAARAGARVLRSEKGRGSQLDVGARAARGDVLLFLHADTQLGAGAREAIEGALADERVLGGNFHLRFDPPGFWAGVFGVANDLRRRLLRIYYGDSAIFVRREAYETIGGFEDLPIMEDYDLVRRLERAGDTAYIREVSALSSARRFTDAPLRTLGTWALVQALYSAGVPATRLARLYADIR